MAGEDISLIGKQVRLRLSRYSGSGGDPTAGAATVSFAVKGATRAPQAAISPTVPTADYRVRFGRRGEVLADIPYGGRWDVSVYTPAGRRVWKSVHHVTAAATVELMPAGPALGGVYVFKIQSHRGGKEMIVHPWH